ncbi:acyltransferase family protein [Massilia sp. Mn16-1_5]|uniref:acyltransferase family protein n=1 Tax=Massilia sp. Mn16-1_5 TaxID=2079199 RepID=UPI00109E9F51|nr:acyltransferase family protein [Massilia sp. Mn16-1_5]THC39779.1 hypothetical protein C2862_23135 [Massilia sp. Mn16-1_5]
MDNTVSLNFSVAKVIAIFTVVASHWFKDIPLWPLATIALFLFGFSSSFFTGRIYGSEVDVGAFWKKKVQRLGVRYWLILMVLGALLLIQGRDVFHWHTLVHIAGLSGVLNLIGASESALGRGLWFFTLLLFFYALYPMLAKALRASNRTSVTLALTAIALLLLNEWVALGFSLWLTMLGFILGIHAGVNRLRLQPRAVDALLVAAPLLLVACNSGFGLKALNVPLLGLFALALSLRLTIPGTPLTWLRPLVALEAFLLEIYLIHSYLFVRPTGHTLVDFALSLVLIVAAAIVLNHAGNRLVARIFAPRAAPVPVQTQREDDDAMAGAA